MPISTFEIILLGVSAMALVAAVFWYTISLQYGNSIQQNTYTRGANVDPGVGYTTGQVNLTCGEGTQICMSRATAICSGTTANNFEANTATDPYLTNGQFSPYPNTIDLTPQMGKLANGKTSFIYSFNADTNKLPSAFTCPINNTRPQLVATYNCVPIGEPCVGYTPK